MNHPLPSMKIKSNSAPERFMRRRSKVTFDIPGSGKIAEDTVKVHFKRPVDQAKLNGILKKCNTKAKAEFTPFELPSRIPSTTTNTGVSRPGAINLLDVTARTQAPDQASSRLRASERSQPAVQKGTPHPAAAGNAPSGDLSSFSSSITASWPPTNLKRRNESRNAHGARGLKRRRENSASQPATDDIISQAQSEDTTETLAAHMLTNPMALKLPELAKLFSHLKTDMRIFCEDYFSFTLTEAEKKAWPIEHLKSKYNTLMRTTQYIADSGPDGWNDLFTHEDHRLHLVYGILGEWFRCHIFDATAFGMSKAEQDELENMDRVYIHYDGFVRSKQRARILQNQFWTKSDLERHRDMTGAVTKLADDLMVVLEPLMETFQIIQATKSNAMAESARLATKSQIRNTLMSLIRSAVALHLSVRFTGYDGTIIRIAPAATKGTEYVHGALMSCLNFEFCNATRPDDDEVAEHELQIKMTCFGRIEAYVPHGPDQLEFEMLMQSAMETGKQVELPLLPVALRTDPRTEDAAKLAARGGPNHGSWINTVYLGPADVYLNWVSKDKVLGGGAEDSLAAAIDEARRRKGIDIFEDLHLAWNSFLYPIGSWSLLALVVAASTGRVPASMAHFPVVEQVVQLVDLVKRGKELSTAALVQQLGSIKEFTAESLSDVVKGLTHLKAVVTGKEFTLAMKTPATTLQSITSTIWGQLLLKQQTTRESVSATTPTVKVSTVNHHIVRD